MIGQLLYWIYLICIGIPLFLLLTLFTSLITIIGCSLGSQYLFSYYPGMIWSWLTCYIALCPVKVSGRENREKNKSYVIISNHQGAFDIFLIYGFLHVPFKWVMKSELKDIPFVGKACKAAGFIFVNNTSFYKALASIYEAEGLLKKGSSIMIFPEGARSHTGKLSPFKKGAFQMATDQHLSILPLTINGPIEILKRGSWKIKPHRMELIIHPPLEPEQKEYTTKKLGLLADKAHFIIHQDLWDKYKS